MNHRNNTVSRQTDIIRNGTREQVIAWLAWNDSNGVYTDQDSIDEGLEPLTIEQARDIMRSQMEH